MKAKTLKPEMVVICVKSAEHNMAPGVDGTPLRIRTIEYPFATATVETPIISPEAKKRSGAWGGMFYSYTDADLMLETKTKTFYIKGCRFQAVSEAYVADYRSRYIKKTVDDSTAIDGDPIL